MCSKLVVRHVGDRPPSARALSRFGNLALGYGRLQFPDADLSAQVDEWEKHLQARPEQPVTPLNLGDIVVVKITRSSEFVYVIPASPLLLFSTTALAAFHYHVAHDAVVPMF